MDDLMNAYAANDDTVAESHYEVARSPESWEDSQWDNNARSLYAPSTLTDTEDSPWDNSRSLYAPSTLTDRAASDGTKWDDDDSSHCQSVYAPATLTDMPSSDHGMPILNVRGKLASFRNDLSGRRPNERNMISPEGGEAVYETYEDAMTSSSGYPPYRQDSVKSDAPDGEDYSTIGE